MADHPVGIDLGTSYSVVAVLYEDKVHVIQNSYGSRISPSCVAFGENECLIGEDATTCKENVAEENLVFDVKRMIGRRFEENILQQDRVEWPFNIRNENGIPVIPVTYKGDDKIFRPEQISAMILGQLKEQAEQFLHQKVTKAVITVPAHFNNAQREATETAAKIAGLDVLRLLNEPTAAALAYGLHKEKEDEKVLVYDLGGGTFDVSVLHLDKDTFRVLSTAGDTHLGGNDFNKRLADHFVKLFKEQHRKDISKDTRARHRLLKVSETIKKNLTATDKCSYKVDYLCEGIDFDINVSREKFNELNDDLFMKTIEHVKLALDDAKLKKSDIDNVILIGGSTRIPKIRSILHDYFEDKQLHLSINPDESVAYGAAIQASIMAGPKTRATDNILLLDVTPLSLGTSDRGELMSFMIRRNTNIPTKVCKGFQTIHADQTRVKIDVYEGEREFVKDNNLLGEFILAGIPPAPAGEQAIDVTFDINADGVLDVIAELCGTDNEGYLTIDRSEDNIPEAKIEEMIKEAQQLKLTDKKDRECFEAKSALLRLTEKISATLTSYKTQFDGKESVTKKLNEIETWMRRKHSKQEYTKMTTDLERIWKPIRVKLMTSRLQRPERPRYLEHLMEPKILCSNYM